MPARKPLVATRTTIRHIRSALLRGAASADQVGRPGDVSNLGAAARAKK